MFHCECIYITSAIAKGSQMLELDCHMTKDGEVVVSHDSHLLNKCGEDVNIAELNLAVSWCIACVIFSERFTHLVSYRLLQELF